MLKEMSQTAGATCNLQIEKGPEECPPKTGAMRDCRIDVGYGCDALLDQPKGLLPYGGLQSVCDMPFDLPPNTDWFLANAGIEGESPFDGVVRGEFAA